MNVQRCEMHLSTIQLKNESENYKKNILKDIIEELKIMQRMENIETETFE